MRDIFRPIHLEIPRQERLFPGPEEHRGGYDERLRFPFPQETEPERIKRRRFRAGAPAETNIINGQHSRRYRGRVGGHSPGELPPGKRDGIGGVLPELQPIFARRDGETGLRGMVGVVIPEAGPEPGHMNPDGRVGFRIKI